MSNPLLKNLTLPAFGRIRPEHIEPAVDQLLEEHRGLLKSLLEKPGEHTWETLFQPLEEKNDQLQRAWSAVRHLHSVADNEALRRAYNACVPKMSDHDTELGQNEDLFRACKSLAEGEQYTRLDVSRKKIIDNALRDSHLSGIDLEQTEKDRYRELQQKLSQLQDTLRGKPAGRHPRLDPAGHGQSAARRPAGYGCGTGGADRAPAGSVRLAVHVGIPLLCAGDDLCR